jgi:hypothetical protein
VASLLPELLCKLPDLERGVTRVFHRTAAPAEFVVVLHTLSQVGGGPRAEATCVVSFLRMMASVVGLSLVVGSGGTPWWYPCF